MSKTRFYYLTKGADATDTDYLHLEKCQMIQAHHRLILLGTLYDHNHAHQVARALHHSTPESCPRCMAE